MRICTVSGEIIIQCYLGVQGGAEWGNVVIRNILGGVTSVYHPGRTQEDCMPRVDRRRNIGRHHFPSHCLVRWVGFVFKGVIWWWQLGHANGGGHL
jgi:hypothetical protein